MTSLTKLVFRNSYSKAHIDYNSLTEQFSSRLNKDEGTYGRNAGR